jgi:hypothetical protein
MRIDLDTSDKDSIYILQSNEVLYLTIIAMNQCLYECFFFENALRLYQ